MILQTIEWEHIKLFDGSCDESISKMTVQEFDKHHGDRMKKNAYIWGGMKLSVELMEHLV